MTGRQKKKPNPPRKCIFCGGTPITGEHLWAAWMRDYLPAGEGTQVIQESDLSTDLIRLRSGPLTRRGDARSQKLKVVCRACNNGWMSRLQTRAQPTLLPLLLNQTKALDENERESLSLWATMFSIVYSTCYPGSGTVITSEQRAAFMGGQKPLEHWIVWAGRFNGEGSPTVQMGFGSSEGRSLLGDKSPPTNRSALTLCGAGGLCLAIFSANSERAFQTFAKFITMLLEPVGLVQIWPASASVVRIDDRMRPLGYRDLVGIREAVKAALQIAARRTPSKRTA